MAWVHKVLPKGSGPLRYVKLWNLGMIQSIKEDWCRRLEAKAAKNGKTTKQEMETWGFKNPLDQDYEASVWVECPEENEFGVVSP